MHYPERRATPAWSPPFLTLFSGNSGPKFRKKFENFPETPENDSFSGSRTRVFACYILDLCPENPRNPRL